MISDIYNFNQSIIGISREKIEPLSDNEYQWFIKALQEELSEIQEAHNDQDIAKFVDGILDLCYFAIGGLARAGIPEELAYACFSAVHSANMTKVKGKQKKRDDFELDAIKPEEFQPAEHHIAKILFQ